MIPGQSAGSPCGLPAGGLASERRVQARENGRMLGMATRQANKPASRQRAGSRPRPGHVLMSPGTGHRGSSSRRCGIALAGVGNGMIHGFEGRRRNKMNEGMKKNQTVKACLPPSCATPTMGWRLSERQALRRPERTKGSNGRRAPPDPRQAETGVKQAWSGRSQDQARSNGAGTGA